MHRDGEHREMTLKGNEIVQKGGARDMSLALQIQGPWSITVSHSY